MQLPKVADDSRCAGQMEHPRASGSSEMSFDLLTKFPKDDDMHFFEDVITQ
jgi:hypothetical protein